MKRYYHNAIRPHAPLCADAELARHLSVAGHRPGDAVRLFDGSGVDYEATVRRIGKRDAELDVGEAAAVDRELPVSVTLAAALPKGPRQHAMIEKLTELGLARFVPLSCRHAVAVIAPADTAKLDKLRRYAIEACKQCGRARIPEIAPPTAFDALIDGAAGYDCRWILSTSADAVPLSRAGLPPLGGEALAAVGPEGGWSPEEEAAARRAGFTPIRIAPAVLRVETAAMALMAQVGACVLGRQSGSG